MIRAIITDFDGTLVDTFEANLRAYQKAYQLVGLDITTEKYRECFGFRFERLMTATGVSDDRIANTIREAKKELYPQFFTYLKPNKALLGLIEGFKALGGKTAMASTARRENLMNVVNYLGIVDHFDLIYAGADVKEGKPSPEIYIKAMDALGVTPEETLIFEDSLVGLQAAEASGADYMKVTI
jgi:HAD superfamily hydrolase (TIGR01509 family)